MEYVINSVTGEDIFFHSSKTGIIGNISPNKNEENKRRDFGDGFYLGNKKNQTIALVNSCPDAKLYSLKIPKKILNEDNTVYLSKEDWMYFVLYNRGYLEEINDTDFYDYYAHLADNKHFIVGTIADDVYSSCMKDFVKGEITDWMFLQLIDRYTYGQQIVAKSQHACDMLEQVECKELTAEDRKKSLASRRLSRKEQELDYQEQKARLLRERKGYFISELFEQIREFTEIDEEEELLEAENICFESPVHEESEVYYAEFYI